MRLTIGRKLQLGMGVLLLLFIVIGLISYYRAGYVGEKMKAITEEQWPISHASLQMEINLVSTSFALLGYLHNRDFKHLPRIEKDKMEFEAFQKKYHELVKSVEGKELGVKIDKGYDQFKELGEVLIIIENDQVYKMLALLQDLVEMNVLLDNIKASIKPNDPLGYQKLEPALETEVNLNEIIRLLTNYRITHDSRYEDQVHDSEQEFQQYLETYEGLTLSSEERQWAEQVHRLFDETAELSEGIIEGDKTKKKFYTEFINIHRQLDTVLNEEIQALTYKNLMEAEKNAFQAIRRTNIIIMGFILLGLVFGIFAVLVTARSITKPLDKLILATEEIAKGDFSLRVDISTKDEIGVLGEYFNNMTDSLQKTTVSRDYVENIIRSMAETLIVLSPEGNIQLVNQATCKLLDYEEEEVVGQPFDRIFSKEELKGTILDDLIKKEVVSNVEKIYLSKVGRKIPVLFSSSVMRNSDVRIQGIVCVAQDITELKQAEEKLRIEKAHLEQLFESAAEAIVMCDTDNRILRINSEFTKLFGYKPKEAIDQFLDDLIASENFYKEAKSYTEDLRVGKKIAFESQRRRNDGTLIDVLAIGSPIIIDNKLIGLYTIYRDITERKRAEEEKKKLEEQLQQAQKMEAIGTLAGGIAHNFNNLLMGIQGNTSLMLLDTDSNHPNYERLKNIEKMVQSGSKLTSQLLGYARGGRYEVRPISFNQLVKNTSDTFDTTRKEIRVHQDLSEKLYGIKADQGQIEQVLLNLYVNAAEAMPGGGDLFLHTINITHKDIKGKPYKVKSGDYILLTIRDTGVGMDKETLERIFDPFFTTKGLAKGTGLGLASVYGIIKAHGGYIDVESKKGQGTTFYVYLPAIKAEGIAQRAESESIVEILKGKETALLVDDEDMVLDVGQDLLKHLGYKVLIASGGKEALEIYEKNKEKIDIVILDMIMPVIGGGKVYDRMKEINPEVKVLLSSGYSINGQATEILKRGCDGFIQKPFTMKELSQSIREVLGEK